MIADRNKKNDKKLGLRLILYFLLISIIPIFILGYFAYKNSWMIVKEKMLNHLSSVVILKEESIKEWREHRISHLEVIADLIKEPTAIVVASPNATRHERGDVYNNLEKTLHKFLGASMFFEFSILGVDDGKIHFSTDKNQIGKIKGSDSSFKEGKTRPSHSNIYYSLTTDTPVISVYAPVFNNLGDIFAVLSGEVDIGNFRELMGQKAGLGMTGKTYLVNKFNFIIDGLGSNNKGVLVKTTYTEAITDCLARNNGGGLYSDYNGIPVVGVYKWVPESEVCILAEIDQKEAFVFTKELKNTILIIALVVTLMVFVLGFLFSRALTKPIKKLIRGTEIIGSGNLGYRIKIDSKDEIGILAESFNVMTAKRRKAEEGLQKEKNIAQNYLDIASVMIVGLDSRGNVTLINRKGCEILGYKKEEIIGKNWIKNFLPKKVAKDARSVFGELMAGNKKLVEHYESPIINKKHEERIIAWYNTLLVDNKGKMVGILSSGHDVTREREFDKIKTDFVSTASHQLRTPLTGIKWFTELLLKGDVGDINKKQGDFLRKIQFSNERLIGLVEDLLDVSRIESDKGFIMRNEIFNITEIIDSVLVDLTPLIEEKKLKIKKTTNLPKGLMVNVDKERLRQAFFNLIDNAVKFSNKSGLVDIEYKTDNDNFFFSVKDVGRGIPDNQKARIFEKFFRASNVISTGPSGTGLGLHIARAIIEIYGGKIWFESKEKRGSIFYITLPLKIIKKH